MRSIHEIEVDEVVDTHCLEFKDSIGKISPLYLGDWGGKQLIFVGLFCENSIALAGTGPASPPRSLFGAGLRNGSHNQGVHAKFGVEYLNLGKTRIDHIVNPVDSQTGLGYIGGNNTFSFSRRGRLEYSALHFAGKSTVNRKNYQLRYIASKSFQPLVEDLAGSIDLFLSS